MFNSSQQTPRAPVQPPPIAVFGLPFDVVRGLHATAVQNGLIPCSMLESRDFELTMVTAERMLLGPLSRRV